jgi:hypothetical protein
MRWSSTNKNGHFGISKLIFSNGCGHLYDKNGKYGLTQWAYAIPIDYKEKDKLTDAFESDEFKNIIDSIQVTSNKYNYKIMKYFKKDFWKEFI